MRSVEQLFEEIEPEQLSKFYALAEIDCWGEEWPRLAAAIHNSLMIAVAKRGGAVTDTDIKDHEYFLPKFRWEMKKKKTRKQSAEEFARNAKSWAGL